MIKKLRSLRDVEIELGKFNVLVGPNASGKSNLLDSLAFLSEIAQKPIGDAFKPRGGFEHVVFGGEEKEIEFFFEFVLDEEPYFHSISICKNEIGEEKLNIGGKIVIDREEYRGRILKADGTLLGDADMSYGQSAVFSYAEISRLSKLMEILSTHNSGDKKDFSS